MFIILLVIVYYLTSILFIPRMFNLLVILFLTKLFAQKDIFIRSDYSKLLLNQEYLLLVTNMNLYVPVFQFLFSRFFNLILNLKDWSLILTAWTCL